MKFSYDIFHTVVVILNSIAPSSQFECLPNGAPIPGVHRGEPSPPASGAQSPPARPHISNSSSHRAGTSLRSRSRSFPGVDRASPTSLPFSNFLGYALDQMESIRLISYKNPQRHSKFRKYAFPIDESMKFLEEPQKYRSIPTQEQIVLSTFDGDVIAKLEGPDILGGIYIYDSIIHSHVRVKINIKSGEVTRLTTDEIKETPVGRHRQILYGYRVTHVNHNNGFLAPDEPQLDSRASSSSGHVALPTRLPSSDGSGYGLDQLQFIRLIPKNDPNQIFELQRYTFPADKLILFLDGDKHYRPIPIQELIVLTKLNSVVFSILESSDALSGIYSYDSRTRAKIRVKINMRSSMVIQLTKHEMKEVPVGHFRSISKKFRIENVNHNHSRLPF